MSLPVGCTKPDLRGFIKQLRGCRKCKIGFVRKIYICSMPKLVCVKDSKKGKKCSLQPNCTSEQVEDLKRRRDRCTSNSNCRTARSSLKGCLATIEGKGVRRLKRIAGRFRRLYSRMKKRMRARQERSKRRWANFLSAAKLRLRKALDELRKRQREEEERQHKADQEAKQRREKEQKEKKAKEEQQKKDAEYKKEKAKLKAKVKALREKWSRFMNLLRAAVQQASLSKSEEHELKQLIEEFLKVKKKQQARRSALEDKMADGQTLSRLEKLEKSIIDIFMLQMNLQFQNVANALEIMLAKGEQISPLQMSILESFEQRGLKNNNSTNIPLHVLKRAVVDSSKLGGWDYYDTFMNRMILAGVGLAGFACILLLVVLILLGVFMSRTAPRSGGSGKKEYVEMG